MPLVWEKRREGLSEFWGDKPTKMNKFPFYSHFLWLCVQKHKICDTSWDLVFAFYGNFDLLCALFMIIRKKKDWRFWRNILVNKFKYFLQGLKFNFKSLIPRKFEQWKLLERKFCFHVSQTIHVLFIKYEWCFNVAWCFKKSLFDVHRSENSSR